MALAAGALAWAGAATQSAGVSLPEMLGAGANCLPAALLFLALGALAFALAPRTSTGIAYGLVGVAFAREMAGALLEAPGWLLGLSPFHDVGLVPGEPFEATAAAIMLAIAALATPRRPLGLQATRPDRDLSHEAAASADRLPPATLVDRSRSQASPPGEPLLLSRREQGT